MRVTGSRLQRSSPQLRPRLVLELTDEARRSGFGDAAPLAPFSLETIEECERALTGIEARLAPIDDGLPPAVAIRTALASFGSELDATPTARLALETALFDLIGQRAGLSVAACLGGGTEIASARVAVNGLLLAAPEDTLADRAVA